MRFLIWLVILFFTGICFSSCVFKSNINTFKSNSNNWLPADFDPKSTVLLIERVDWPERQQRIIREFMKEKYPYKYRFLRSPNIDEDFPDTATYRFVLFYSANTHAPELGDKTVLGNDKVTSTMFDFHFYDRSKNLSYSPSGIGASWASMPFKWMINYILANKK